MREDQSTVTERGRVSDALMPPGGYPRIDTARPRGTELVSCIDRALAVPGFGTEIGPTLSWARDTAVDLRAGSAPHADVWQLLAATAAVDVGAARILEPHVDALRIIDEAGMSGAEHFAAIGADASSTWGVFAAEGPGTRVVAEERSDRKSVV